MVARMINSLGLLICLLLLGTAAYFQLVLGIEPCPLCIMQRLFILLIGIILLIAVIHNPGQRGIGVYAVLTILTAIGGAIFAGRQTYLQLSPPNPSAICLPGLTYMIKQLPVTETLKIMLTGSGNCTIVSWKFLGLTTPMWTLIFFALLIGLGFWQLVRNVQEIT